MWRISLLVIPTLAVVVGFGGHPQVTPPKPTFSKDVAPILYKRCISCHSESKIAPFSLVGYTNARKWALTIAAVTERGFMPPWKAKANFGEFKEVQALTPNEKQILKRWANTGTPEGNPKETPAPPLFIPGWRVGEPDLILAPELPTLVPAEGKDFFRDYLIDPHITKPTWVRAIDFLPKEQGTVHHIIPSLITKEEAEKLRKIKYDFDDHSWKQKTVEDIKTYNMLGFWSTGSSPFVAPQDTAFLIKPGDCFLLDIHYKPKGKPEMEQPQVALYLQDETPKDELSVNVISTGDIYLQPEQSNARFFAIGEKSEHDTTIYSVWPHMHYLGMTFKAWVKFPGGYSKPLVAIDEWDPDWQLLYYLKTPMRVPKGSKIYVTGTYDNSKSNPRNPHSPSRVVEAGESSKDEMLLFEMFQVEHKPKGEKPKVP